MRHLLQSDDRTTAEDRTLFIDCLGQMMAEHGEDFGFLDISYENDHKSGEVIFTFQGKEFVLRSGSLATVAEDERKRASISTWPH